MSKTPQSRPDVPWTKRQEIPDIQILDAADQYQRASKLLAEQPLGSIEVLPLMNTAAMAVELYLKCLSAELIYIKDDLMPEASRVYSKPAITTGKEGHGLVGLLEAMPTKVRCLLNDVFDAALGASWNKDLQSVLEDLEGVFKETRYPFEPGFDITRYSHGHLVGLADFLGHFVRNLPPTSHIEWKS